MKEYISQVNGVWRLAKDNEMVSGRIEVPEGAKFAIKYHENLITFYKIDGKSFLYANKNSHNEWRESETTVNTGDAIWQRPCTRTLAEYLNPTDWSLHVVDVDNDAAGKDWIKVPEGAEIFVIFDKDVKDNCFYKENLTYGFDDREDDWWEADITIDAIYGRGGSVVWKRHTQPEELPFIDDEPKDNVNHPSHYTQGDIECIDAIKASMSHEAYCGYLKGNVQKYMWRYEHKGGVESLKKAQWYLNKLIVECSQ